MGDAPEHQHSGERRRAFRGKPRNPLIVSQEVSKMRRLAVFAGALALAFAATAEETPATSPKSDGDARKHLADFFLRTKGSTRVVSAADVWQDIQSGKAKYRVVDVRPPDD